MGDKWEKGVASCVLKHPEQFDKLEISARQMGNKEGTRKTSCGPRYPEQPEQVGDKSSIMPPRASSAATASGEQIKNKWKTGLEHPEQPEQVKNNSKILRRQTGNKWGEQVQHHAA